MNVQTWLWIAALAVLPVSLVAQDRDRSRSDWNVADLMRSADDNGDGMIEPSELGRTSGYYVRLAAQRIGLDPNGNLPTDKIRPALEAMKAEGVSSSGNSSGGPGNNSSGNNNPPNNSAARPAPPPGGPQGFGVAAAAATVPGFNVPLSVTSGGTLEKQSDPRVLEYVADMIRERDANRNGVLEKGEWTGRWSTPPEESDLNRDSILSKEELYVRIAKRFNISGSPRGQPHQRELCRQQSRCRACGCRHGQAAELCRKPDPAIRRKQERHAGEGRSQKPAVRASIGRRQQGRRDHDRRVGRPPASLQQRQFASPQ